MQILFLSHFLSNFKVINSPRKQIFILWFSRSSWSRFFYFSALINDSEENLWEDGRRRKCYLATHNTWWHESTRSFGWRKARGNELYQGIPTFHNSFWKINVLEKEEREKNDKKASSDRGQTLSEHKFTANPALQTVFGGFFSYLRMNL